MLSQNKGKILLYGVWKLCISALEHVIVKYQGQSVNYIFRTFWNQTTITTMPGTLSSSVCL